MKWDLHVDSVCKKITSFSSVFKRLGNRINQRIKRQVYFAMIHSHLTYLSAIWGTTTTEVDIRRLQTSQNNALRKIFNYEYALENLSTTEIKKIYEIMDIKQIIKLNRTMLIYKISKRLIKSNYQLNFLREHRYQTRADRPTFVHFRTNVGKNSVFRSCTELFFDMRLNGYNEVSPNLFKKRLKSVIMEYNNWKE